MLTKSNTSLYNIILFHIFILSDSYLNLTNLLKIKLKQYTTYGLNCSHLEYLQDFPELVFIRRGSYFNTLQLICEPRVTND